MSTIAIILHCVCVWYRNANKHRHLCGWLGGNGVGRAIKPSIKWSWVSLPIKWQIWASCSHLLPLYNLVLANKGGLKFDFAKLRPYNSARLSSATSCYSALFFLHV